MKDKLIRVLILVLMFLGMVFAFKWKISVCEKIGLSFFECMMLS